MPLLLPHMLSTGPVRSVALGGGASGGQQNDTLQEQGVHTNARDILKQLFGGRMPYTALTALSFLGASLVLAFVVVQCFNALNYKRRTNKYGGAERILAEERDNHCSVSSFFPTTNERKETQSEVGYPDEQQ